MKAKTISIQTQHSNEKIRKKKQTTLIKIFLIFKQDQNQAKKTKIKKKKANFYQVYQTFWKRNQK